MTDSSRDMHAHVALRLRLIYELTGPRADLSALPSWELAGMLPEDAGEDTAPDSSRRRLVTEPVLLTLDRDEAEGYYLNLTSPQPSLFVLLGRSDVAAATMSGSAGEAPQTMGVTASYAEAARWMDGGMVVQRTLLPQPMLAWIAEFAQHHFQVEGRKKRGKFRPSFLSRQEFGEEAKAALRELEQAPGQVEGTGASAAANHSLRQVRH
jgi:hypothetical protein